MVPELYLNGEDEDRKNYENQIKPSMSVTVCLCFAIFFSIRVSRGLLKIGESASRRPHPSAYKLGLRVGGRRPR